VSAWATQQSDVALRVRIGVHTGQAITESDDFFGKEVIIAARIADLANGGQVLVSAVARDSAAGGAEFRFGPPQRVELKGLSGSYEVCELTW